MDVMPFFYNRRSKESELRVLLVSDARCSLVNVNRIAESLTSKCEYVDMIILTGNITNLQVAQSPSAFQIVHYPIFFLYFYAK